jgi:hypothetical protein
MQEYGVHGVLDCKSLLEEEFIRICFAIVGKDIFQRTIKHARKIAGHVLHVKFGRCNDAIG